MNELKFLFYWFIASCVLLGMVSVGIIGFLLLFGGTFYLFSAIALIVFSLVFNDYSVLLNVIEDRVILSFVLFGGFFWLVVIPFLITKDFMKVKKNEEEVVCCNDCSRKMKKENINGLLHWICDKCELAFPVNNKEFDEK